jgi:hypothetical protein
LVLKTPAKMRILLAASKGEVLIELPIVPSGDQYRRQFPVVCSV